MDSDTLNKLFMRIQKRAEQVDGDILVQTFVDLDPLVTLLSTRDHQVIYGRRGTGKTHALRFLRESRNTARDVAVYVDMRTIGSSGGIYADPSLSRAERGTRLIMDTLGSIHESLMGQVLLRTEELDLSVLGPLMDSFAKAITEVRVEGTVEVAETDAQESSQKTSNTGGFEVGQEGITADRKFSDSTTMGHKSSVTTTEKGTLKHRVHFGSLTKALSAIASHISKLRLWILLDEWSAVPIDLQPILADLIRRSLLPVNGVTVKIGAIEHRSIFQEQTTLGDYLGIELGADVSADLNLDDFMVFDNSAERAKQFFAQLIYRHSLALANEDGISLEINSPEDLTAAAFMRRDVFEEYVRASEGVPRDAINILSLPARRAGGKAISMDNVRGAARTWYEQDKQAAVISSSDSHGLLLNVIDEVIGNKRARAFLLKSGVRHPLIDELFDKRVLHILKRNVSAKDEPGVRYNVFKIDYGCYVDLLTTNKSPQGLLLLDEEGEDAEQKYVEVPPDDYRAIRRAILKLENIGEPEVPKLFAPQTANSSEELPKDA